MNTSRSMGRLARALVLAAFVSLPLAPLEVARSAADPRQEVLEQTASLRGLAVLREVLVEFVTSEHVRTDLEQQAEQEESRDSLAVTQKLLLDLGLLREDEDLTGLLVGVYGDSIAGYYSRREKKMFVVGDALLFGPRERLTLAHEFTHALQDQHFNLSDLTSTARGNDDRSAALAALVEGDASIASFEYARLHFTPEDRRAFYMSSGDGRPSTLEQAPLVIRDEVIFPYREGSAFVRTLLQSGGFAAVNQAFEAPPISTEQVLHPAKYAQREEAVDVRLPDLTAGLGEGWTQLRSNVLGELDLRILIEQHAGTQVAAAGSAGWGGDRYALLEHADGARALVLRTVWDSEEEADQFFGAYGMALHQRFGTAGVAQHDGASLLWSLPQGVVYLTRHGARVESVQAADQETLNRLVELLAAE